MREQTLSYDEIRPYYDHEVNEVLHRISQGNSFYALMQYLFPGSNGKHIAEQFQKINNTHDFQSAYIQQAVRQIISDSTNGITSGGLENMKSTQRYLILSNHRDIIMDSAILNVLLFEKGFETTQIAIGNNLMVSPLVTDLMKLNKSFIVHRKVPMRKILPYAQRLSTYIRSTIVEDKASIWMSHRNGRAKDGDDRTQPALLKMLNISGEEDIEQNFRELNIIPMSISYEFEPCDALKAEELVHKDLDIPYEKDDKEGMIRGIRDQKGRVHLQIGKPLLDNFPSFPQAINKKAYLQELADYLSTKIFSLYKLWPTHFVAADLLEKGERFKGQYTEQDKSDLLSLMHERLADKKGDPSLLQKQYLEIYARPVWNREGL